MPTDQVRIGRLHVGVGASAAVLLRYLGHQSSTLALFCLLVKRTLKTFLRTCHAGVSMPLMPALLALPEPTPALVFPAIAIVRRLPKNDLARYMERARPRRIDLSWGLLDFAADIQRRIILHEIGHWWHCEHLGGLSWSRARAEKFADDFSNSISDTRGTGPLGYPSREIRAFARECYSRLHTEARSTPTNQESPR